MKFKESEVRTHDPIDTTDPGFKLKGKKLRWVSDKVEVRRAARIWETLKVSMFEPKTLAEIKKRSGKWINGDTFRRGDLTLSFASLEAVEERRRKVRQQQQLNESVFKGKRQMGAATAEGQTQKERVSSPTEEFR